MLACITTLCHSALSIYACIHKYIYTVAMERLIGFIFRRVYNELQLGLFDIVYTFACIQRYSSSWWLINKGTFAIPFRGYN